LESVQESSHGPEEREIEIKDNPGYPWVSDFETKGGGEVLKVVSRIGKGKSGSAEEQRS